MNNSRGIWRGKPIEEDEQIDRNEWVEGFLAKRTKSYAKIVDDEDMVHFVDPKTLGECTGLTDKNGTRIFEGDIVHAVYKFGYGGVKDTDFGNGVVEYHGNYYSGARWEMNIIGEAGCRVFSASIECEVIGNIYDDPELLKVAISSRRVGT